jgi:hypothetical protein
MSNYQARLAQFIQVLAPKPQDTRLHLTIDQVDDYVHAQLAGQSYIALFPEAVRHLDSCIACAESYQLLYELALAETMARLPIPASMPTPDLAFLVLVPSTSLIEQIRAAVQRIGQQISLQLTPALLPALRPAYALSTLRSAAPAQRYGEKLIHLEPPADLLTEWPVSLVVYRDVAYNGLCLVEIMVEPPGRYWPDLAGILVTLTINQETQSDFTDAWGMVVFERAPIAWLSEMKITVNGLQVA